MKRNAFLLLSLAALLTSCGGVRIPTVSSSSSEGSSATSQTDTGEQSVSHSSEESSSASSSKESSSQSSSKSSSASESSSAAPSTDSSSSGSSTVSSSSKENPMTDGVYNFYCLNDFHGSVVEQMNGRYYEAGIAKLFGKLKSLKEEDPEHTFLFSSGDMFQGSLESNDNFGALVTECMNAAGFDAMEVGNHEFDYGIPHLLDFVEWADFPVLGGNVMRYENGPTDQPWNEDVFAKSATFERGGNKIGVVGMIGYGQTSSITSKYVEDIYFANPYRLAQDEATRLREEEDCDLVIYLLHDDMSNCVDYVEKEYFDGVFCGHRHTKNDKVYGGVPFVQSYCNGEAYSHFQITIKDNVATCTRHGVYWADDEWGEDEEIASIRDSYLEDPDFRAKADAFAGTVNGTLTAKEGVSNLIAKGIYEKYSRLYPNLVGAMQNGLRANLSGDIDYRDIYKAAPFTNHVVIAEVLGSEILSEGALNSFYRADHDTFEPNEYYTIACVDYVLYHQNDNKRFNYFPSLNDDPEGRIKADYEDFPFDIAFDYIKNTLGGVVDPNDFANSSEGFGV